MSVDESLAHKAGGYQDVQGDGQQDQDNRKPEEALGNNPRQRAWRFTTNTNSLKKQTAHTHTKKHTQDSLPKQRLHPYLHDSQGSSK